MAYDVLTGTWTLSPLMEKLVAEKKSATELQERKHIDWDDNYDLYRNKVKTNRLTQRQAVNIPLMKETIKTLMSRVDDPPTVDWRELGGDEMKETIYQEVWNQAFKDNNLELIDTLDKKNVLLYGCSFKKLNLSKDGVKITVNDIYDVMPDPLMSVWDIETARFIVHHNIFRSVREILADDRYSSTGKKDLKIWMDSPPGMLQSEKSREEWEKKMKRLEDMGVTNDQFPLFAGGDRIVNLTEHFTQVWSTKLKRFERRVAVYADDKILLLDESLKDLIGVEFWPFEYWSEDPEVTDVYPDSVADLVRTPNKVINVWFSQLIENRTLKNFQMHWFLPNQNYSPQTYTPGPGMMLPAPPGDDINKVIKPVEVSGLEDTLGAIGSIISLVERATGATAIEKGVSQTGVQTLGEVEILVGKAQERSTAMTKFYRMSWYRLAKKWDKMMQANAPKIMTLYKESRSGKVYPKRVYAGDWVSETGYEPTVRSTSEQETEQTKGLQRLMFVMQQFPNNIALRKIIQKRELELLDLTPEELRQVEEAEEQQAEQMMQQAQNQQAQPGIQPPNPATGTGAFQPIPQAAPAEQDLMQQAQQQMNELQQVNA